LLAQPAFCLSGPTSNGSSNGSPGTRARHPWLRHTVTPPEPPESKGPCRHALASVIGSYPTLKGASSGNVGTSPLHHGEASERPMTKVRSLSRWSDLHPLSDLISTSTGSHSALTLDLSSLDREGVEARRLDLLTVALLANLLVGVLSDAPLSVSLPAAPSMLAQLRRGGLFFALAQRRGAVTWQPRGASDLVENWSGAWRPAMGDKLFVDDAAAAEVDERLYLYANTHRLGQGYFRQYQPGAAMPWLADLVPVPRDRTLRQVRQDFVASAVEAIIEVLENVASHAFKRRQRLDDDWLRPHGRRAKSMLLCSLTKGGGTASWDRLHVLAMDNGYGIGRTLRWQHPDATGSTAELLEAVLQRKFLERGIPGHSGRGLWYLHGLSRIAGGAVHVVTEDDQSRDRHGIQFGFSSPPAEGGSTSWETAEEIALPVRGTILLLDLAVPSASHGDAAPMGAEYRALRSVPVPSA